MAASLDPDVVEINRLLAVLSSRVESATAVRASLPARPATPPPPIDPEAVGELHAVADLIRDAQTAPDTQHTDRDHYHNALLAVERILQSPAIEAVSAADVPAPYTLPSSSVAAASAMALASPARIVLHPTAGSEGGGADSKYAQPSAFRRPRAVSSERDTDSDASPVDAATAVVAPNVLRPQFLRSAKDEADDAARATTAYADAKYPPAKRLHAAPVLAPAAEVVSVELALVRPANGAVLEALPPTPAWTQSRDALMADSPSASSAASAVSVAAAIAAAGSSRFARIDNNSLIGVLRCLRTDDMLNATLVCRQWARAAHSPVLWPPTMWDLHPQVVLSADTSFRRLFDTLTSRSGRVLSPASPPTGGGGGDDKSNAASTTATAATSATAGDTSVSALVLTIAPDAPPSARDAAQIACDDFARELEALAVERFAELSTKMKLRETLDTQWADGRRRRIAWLQVRTAVYGLAATEIAKFRCNLQVRMAFADGRYSGEPPATAHNVWGINTRHQRALAGQTQANCLRRSWVVALPFMALLAFVGLLCVGLAADSAIADPDSALTSVGDTVEYGRWRMALIPLTMCCVLLVALTAAVALVALSTNQHSIRFYHSRACCCVQHLCADWARLFTAASHTTAWLLIASGLLVVCIGAGAKLERTAEFDSTSYAAAMASASWLAIFSPLLLGTGLLVVVWSAPLGMVHWSCNADRCRKGECDAYALCTDDDADDGCEQCCPVSIWSCVWRPAGGGEEELRQSIWTLLAQMYGGLFPNRPSASATYVRGIAAYLAVAFVALLLIPLKLDGALPDGSSWSATVFVPVWVWGAANFALVSCTNAFVDSAYNWNANRATTRGLMLVCFSFTVSSITLAAALDGAYAALSYTAVLMPALFGLFVLALVAALRAYRELTVVEAAEGLPWKHICCCGAFLPPSTPGVPQPAI